MADTGIGIKPEDHAILFKDFEKIDLDDRKSMNATGVGLGLVISNDLARSLGPPGREKPIEVKSEFGIGTTFEFEIMNQNSSNQIKDNEIGESNGNSRIADEGELKINLKSYTSFKINESNLVTSKYLRLHSEENVFLQSQNSAPDCFCPTVLIVDDDMFNVSALETLLQSLQIMTVSAFNGKIAIEKYIRRENNGCGPNCRPFSLILMDCNMPVVDGYEAARKLKIMMQKGEIRECPIVGCTAMVRPSEMEKCRECGMDEYIGKPLEPKILIRLLRKYLPC